MFINTNLTYPKKQNYTSKQKRNAYLTTNAAVGVSGNRQVAFKGLWKSIMNAQNTLKNAKGGANKAVNINWNRATYAYDPELGTLKRVDSLFAKTRSVIATANEAGRKRLEKQSWSNKITGCTDLKEVVHNKILEPLFSAMEGSDSQALIPNRITFFGPKGTGKTFLSRQLGNHYSQNGGYYEELDLSGDAAKDVKYLTVKFAEAKNKFKESKNKKYTMFFIDEIEKMLAKNSASQRPVINKLSELTKNGKDNGAILISSANYLEKAEPLLISNGVSDLLIPVGHIDKNDFASMVGFYIKKYKLPIEADLNLDSIKPGIGLRYKPKDIELKLNEMAKPYEECNEKFGISEIQNALLEFESDINSKDVLQFNTDKAYAKSLSQANNLTKQKAPTIEDKGLDAIVGASRLKVNLYNNILKPLSDVIAGGEKKSLIPNGVTFFGPYGTGKTHIAKQLGEQYVKEGGFFEELKFSGKLAEDSKYLKAKFAEAKDKFSASDNKKYTMFFIDDLDKIKKNNDYWQLKEQLIQSTNNCKNRGVILISTAHYLSDVNSYFLVPGRTGFKIPVGYIEGCDLKDMANYYLKKNGVRVKDNVDLGQVIESIKDGASTFSPATLDSGLAKISKSNQHELGEEELRNALIHSKELSPSTELWHFARDITLAKSF